MEAAGSSFRRTVKVHIYLTDVSDFTAVNEVYAEFMAPPYPARSCVAVAALPKNAQVEIEAIAIISND